VIGDAHLTKLAHVANAAELALPIGSQLAGMGDAGGVVERHRCDWLSESRT
jgi:hypothetical protein